MKTKQLLALAALLWICEGHLHAQTASNYIAQGRSYLAVSNIVLANQSFSNALVLSPTDPTGSAFYAATRLLVLPSQPIGSNFLTRWGFPAAGRNIYQWKSVPPKDTNGVFLAPAGVDANEATSLLRTNILAVVIGAESNLANITATNYTLALTAQDTGSVAVTLDYGDIQMLRAMLDASEYFIYNTYDWNLDAQLTLIRSFYASNSFSIGGLLAACPSLLTFATTNDLGSAESAFLNGEGRYQAASQFIRTRPTNTVRLFNYDPGEVQSESDFRLTLADLASSVSNGVVPLEINSNYSVFMPALLSGTHSIRSLLPSFQGAAFVAGSLPDPTFGGFVFGLSDTQLENALAKDLQSVPNILHPTGSPLQIPVRGVANRGYVIQFSTNFNNWSNVTSFVTFNGTYSFADPTGYNKPRGFYRVVDATADMPAPPNDNFANRIPLTGLEIQTAGYVENATVENGEPGSGFPTVWWSWTAPSSGLVDVNYKSDSGETFATIYTGTTFATMTSVDDLSYSGTNSYSGYAFLAAANTTYQIQLADYPFFGAPLGATQISIGNPPLLNVTSPVDGATITNTVITLSCSASGVLTNLASISYSVEQEVSPYQTWSGSSAGPSLNVTFTNLPAGDYYFSETATDGLGISTSTQQSVTLVSP